MLRISLSFLEVCIFVCLIADSLCNSNRTEGEICSLLGENRNISDFIKLKLNSEESNMLLDKCCHIFYYKIPQDLTGQRVKFQIWFNNFSSYPFSNPVLMGSIGQIPSINLTAITGLNYDFQARDTNGFSFRKKYQVVTLSIDKNKVGSYIYFILYKDVFSNPKDFEKEYLNYNYSFTRMSAAECRYPCGSNGYCSTKSCICDPGYFDTDCSIQLPILYFDGNVTFKVKPGQYSGFAIPIFDRREIKIKIQVYSSSSKIYPYAYFASNDEFIIPNSVTYDDSFPSLDPGLNFIELVNAIQTLSYIIISLWSDNYGEELLVVSFANSPEISESDSSLKVVWILAGILCSLIIISIVYKKRRMCFPIRNQTQILIRQTILIETLPSFSPKELETFFPKITYEDRFSDFEQSTCPICLDEFQPEAICREIIPCQHIFHQGCIDAWMKAKYRCPSCNKPFDKKEIECFIRKGDLHKLKSKAEKQKAEENLQIQDLNIALDEDNENNLKSEEELPISSRNHE